MYAVGLMSGTSLDGVDAVLVEITGQGLETDLKILGFDTFDIPDDLKKEVKQAFSETEGTVDLICSLNFKLGYLFSDCVKQLCTNSNFPLEKLDFIASHGQTVFHIPKAEGGYAASTLQIGEAAVIAYETKTQVISNFRVMDMAAGGEGAPLVPFSEYVLYGNKENGLILQNIGGIGNATCVPKNPTIDDLFAFDTGPGNMVIDEAMLQLYNTPYDDNGKTAATGSVHQEMLDDMMSHPYVTMEPPKTTGRELFGEQYVTALLKKYSNVKKEDVIATVTMFTAETIAYQYKTFILPKYDITKAIIGGGGSHNKTLLSYLSTLLPGIDILTQEDIGYSSDAKEALAFVILGNETLHKSFSNVPSATGASKKVLLGNITPVPY